MARRTEGKHLPPALSRGGEKVHEGISFGAQRSDALTAR